jgi:hypothetical protein
MVLLTYPDASGTKHLLDPITDLENHIRILEAIVNNNPDEPAPRVNLAAARKRLCALTGCEPTDQPGVFLAVRETEEDA